MPAYPPQTGFQPAMPMGVGNEYYGVPHLPPEEQQYSRAYDQIENYGSIIKDLTDTEEMLLKWELQLTGKTFDEKGNIVDDERNKPRIKDIQVAKELIALVRSIANQNTHFSGFEDKDVYHSLDALNYSLNRWMMFQGDKIPRLYRQKLSLEAMNICKASLMKANKALILQWSKGNIKEGTTTNYNPNGKKSMFSWLFPGNK